MTIRQSMPDKTKCKTCKHALEVEPLVFEYRQARCRYGIYSVAHEMQDQFGLYLNGVRLDRHESVDQAEQAAQEHHRREVMKMLRYGGDA